MPVEHGPQLGARIGYALPVGTISQASSGATSGPTHLSDLETASVPLGIDAGYRFSKVFYLGGTITWGLGIDPNSHRTCPATDSCWRQNAELRLDARFYFARERKVDWWTSLGTGWEVAAFSQSKQGNSVTSTLTGPVFADVQFGFDWRRGYRTFGPYFGLSVAEFLTRGVNPSAVPESTWMPDPGVHTWITLGLRGSYGPW
jgi:hypothetical protein